VKFPPVHYVFMYHRSSS